MQGSSSRCDDGDDLSELSEQANRIQAPDRLDRRRQVVEEYDTFAGNLNSRNTQGNVLEPFRKTFIQVGCRSKRSGKRLPDRLGNAFPVDLGEEVTDVLAYLLPVSGGNGVRYSFNGTNERTGHRFRQCRGVQLLQETSQEIKNQRELGNQDLSQVPPCVLAGCVDIQNLVNHGGDQFAKPVSIEVPDEISQEIYHTLEAIGQLLANAYPVDVFDHFVQLGSQIPACFSELTAL